MEPLRGTVGICASFSLVGHTRFLPTYLANCQALKRIGTPPL